MNCEILYRGKGGEGLLWYEGMPVRASDPPYSICAISIPEKRTRVQINPETIGQYTGLTDRNSKKIFEGDIVELFVFRGQIIQMCGAFGVSVKPAIDWNYLASEINPVTGCDNSPIFCQNDNFVSLWELMWNYNQEENMCDVIEVVGNIHDNPEMLGGTENDGTIN